MAKKSNPLKWPGGKTPLARRIVARMPEHARLIEPFCGGAAVALEHARQHPGFRRVIADLNGPLATFWQALQSEAGLAHLTGTLPRRLPTPEEFAAAGQTLADADASPEARAAAFFVRNRASRAADMRSYLTPTARFRRGMDEQLSAWLSALDALPDAHRRLHGAEILHADAFGLIEQYRGDRQTVLYLDPPYLHSTRSGSHYYEHELSDADHVRLLDLLVGARCKVLLSGYRSELYDAALTGWHRDQILRRNSMAGGEEKREMLECLWLNFTPPRPGPRRRPLVQRLLF